MAVVEYKRHRVAGGITTPIWIVDGGYWLSPVDKTLVGWVEDEADREYYVPDTVTVLSRDDFITRAKAIHAHTPMLNMPEDPSQEPTQMTEAEVEAQAGAWFDGFHAS